MGKSINVWKIIRYTKYMTKNPSSALNKAYLSRLTYKSNKKDTKKVIILMLLEMTKVQ